MKVRRAGWDDTNRLAMAVIELQLCSDLDWVVQCALHTRGYPFKSREVDGMFRFQEPFDGRVIGAIWLREAHWQDQATLAHEAVHAGWRIANICRSLKRFPKSLTSLGLRGEILDEEIVAYSVQSIVHNLPRAIAREVKLIRKHRQ